VVHVEVAPGVVTVVSAWMLDAAACEGMEIGPARVEVAALADLHRLLTTLARQLAMALDGTRLWGMTPVERDAVVAALASLLLEAAGVAARESRNDRS
jgi:hypothetical protein